MLFSRVAATSCMPTDSAGGFLWMQNIPCQKFPKEETENLGDNMTQTASGKQPQKFTSGFLTPCPGKPSECLYPVEFPKTLLLTSPPMKLQRKADMSNSLDGPLGESRKSRFPFQPYKSPWNPFECSLCPHQNSLDKKDESIRIHHLEQRRSHHPSLYLTTATSL